MAASMQAHSMSKCQHHQPMNGTAVGHQQQDMTAFAEALRAAAFLALGGCVLVQFLGRIVGEEAVEKLVDGLLKGLVNTL